MNKNAIIKSMVNHGLIENEESIKSIQTDGRGCYLISDDYDERWLVGEWESLLNHHLEEIARPSDILYRSAKFLSSETGLPVDMFEESILSQHRDDDEYALAICEACHIDYKDIICDIIATDGLSAIGTEVEELDFQTFAIR